LKNAVNKQKLCFGARRCAPEGSVDKQVAALAFDGGCFEPLRGELRIGEQHQAQLRPRTAAVLAYLIENRGRVVGRAELMQQVWPDVVVTDDSLAQCIKEIRRALGPAAERLRTIPRVGYAFTDGRPSTAAPLVPGGRPGWAANRWLAAALVLLLAALVLGLALRQAARTPPPFSVVVLPLANIGGDASQEYFAEGVTDALTTDLSRISGAFVIARGTAIRYRGKAADAKSVGHELGVRYAVEGGVRRAGEQVVVDLRLVDALDGSIVWSDRIEGARADLDMLQRDITGRIARSLHLEIIDAEAMRAHRHPSADTGAHDLAMQGWSLWNRQDRADNLRARERFERALALDPTVVEAWAGLSNTYVSEIFIDRTKDRAEPLRQAVAAAHRAFAINPKHHNAMGSMATVLAMQGRHDEALALFQARLKLNPNYAPSWMWSGMVQMQLGRFDEAAASAERAIRLSPRDARLPYFYSVVARARLHGGDAKAALEAAERAAQAPGPNTYAPLLVAGAAMRLGDGERARRVVAEFVARNPGYTAASMRAGAADWGAPYRQREEALIESLRNAGLPGP
jgi:TolB-like protein/DNA-binding winged helix-turn-helix (wHTH) protein/Tfp pilus assembly protein PilF